MSKAKKNLVGNVQYVGALFIMPVIPKTDALLKPRKQRLIIEMPFIDDISMLAMSKPLNDKTGCTDMV